MKKKKKNEVKAEKTEFVAQPKKDTIAPISTNEKMVEEEVQDFGALPAPKVPNQKQLDSIKAEKMKLKRKK